MKEKQVAQQSHHARDSLEVLCKTFRRCLLTRVPQLFHPVYNSALHLGLMKLWHLLFVSFMWIGGVLAYRFWPEDEIVHAPGILIPEEPKQGNISRKRMWQHKGYWFEPLATFHLSARVLHKKTYDFGREADLSPLDLALGWGPMSDQRILDRLSISQSSRWYFVRYKSAPLARSAITNSSANMHMIPADDDIEDMLNAVRHGNLITLRGYLVAVRADDGWRWRSSLRRDDTGNGSCEVVWVEEVSILK